MSNKMIPDRVAERAATRYRVNENGCHISTYSVASHGYAQIGWKSKDEGRGATTAHRAAWVHAYGQIPEGMTVDHTCKTKPCVKVDHLRLLSNYENARRTNGRDWPEGQCANGHQNSELVSTSGHTNCRLCLNDWNRSWRARNRDRYNAQQREYRERNRDKYNAQQRERRRRAS